MVVYCVLSQTPLHIAAQEGDMNKVTKLVENNGARVDTKDKYGVSKTMLIVEDN